MCIRDSCWCVLWRIRKTAFHSREGKRKWQTLSWKSVTQTGWRLQVSCAIWFHIPAGQSACSHDKACSKLDCRQLQWLQRKKNEWPPNSPDHQTIMSEKLCVNATRHFNPAKYHRRAEESLAVHMGRSATELYTEHRKKNFELVWKLGPDTLNTS